MKRRRRGGGTYDSDGDGDDEDRMLFDELQALAAMHNVQLASGETRKTTSEKIDGLICLLYMHSSLKDSITHSGYVHIRMLFVICHTYLHLCLDWIIYSL